MTLFGSVGSAEQGVHQVLDRYWFLQARHVGITWLYRRIVDAGHENGPHAFGPQKRQPNN